LGNNFGGTVIQLLYDKTLVYSVQGNHQKLDVAMYNLRDKVHQI